MIRRLASVAVCLLATSVFARPEVNILTIRTDAKGFILGIDGVPPAFITIDKLGIVVTQPTDLARWRFT